MCSACITPHIHAYCDLCRAERTWGGGREEKQPFLDVWSIVLEPYSRLGAAGLDPAGWLAVWLLTKMFTAPTSPANVCAVRFWRPFSRKPRGFGWQGCVHSLCTGALFLLNEQSVVRQLSIHSPLWVQEAGHCWAEAWWCCRPVPHQA